jgi:hypothetical protein
MGASSYFTTVYTPQQAGAWTPFSWIRQYWPGQVQRLERRRNLAWGAPDISATARSPAG